MLKEKVYIILVNYKSWKDTVECLESILKQSYTNFQIIIVDNSPDRDSIKGILKWGEGNLKDIETNFFKLVHPSSTPIDIDFVEEHELCSKVWTNKIITVKAESNKGFSAANNIALRYVVHKNDYKFCWLLNNDTVIDKNALNSLIFSQKKLRVDLLGSILMEYYRPDEIQSIGGKYIAHMGMIEINKKKSKKPDYPIGASLFVTNFFLTNVGLLCEDYFLFFEEYDWTLRAKKKGLDFAVEYDAIIFHKGGAAIGNSSKLADFYGVKSKFLFNKKFFKKTLILFHLLFGTFYIINRVIRFQPERIKLYFKLLYNSKLSYHEAIDK